jgi:microcystin-dependent protein
LPQDPVSDQRSDPLGTAVDDLGARLAALEETGQWWPGQISWTAAATAPQGWLVADGSDFDGDRYAALAAVLGGTTLPDLRNRFPIGAGDTYALLATGGASDVTLTGAQSGQPAIAAGTSGSTTPGVTGGPSTANTGAEAAHTHNIPPLTGEYNDASTGAGAAIPIPASFGTGAHNYTLNTNTTSGAGSSHSHTLSAHTHTSAAHTHTTPAIAAANAASPHSVLNPYVGLTPLIHI